MRNNLISLVLALFTTNLLTGCMALHDSMIKRDIEKYRSRIKQEMDTVNISDGVNESEAKAIAKNFLLDKNSRIGLDTAIAYDQGNSWKVDFDVCISAIPQGITSTFVDKTTGEISWNGKFEIKDEFKKMWK